MYFTSGLQCTVFTWSFRCVVSLVEAGGPLSQSLKNKATSGSTSHRPPNAIIPPLNASTTKVEQSSAQRAVDLLTCSTPNPGDLMGPSHRPKPPLLGEQMSKQRVCWRWPCVTTTSGSNHGTVNWARGFHEGLHTTQIGKTDSSNYTSVPPLLAYWDRPRVVNHL